jgi:DNA-directed RNA polymerase specialized sigma24 family protein
MTERTDAAIEDLLAHQGWLRGLALHLARDGATADDLVQETWVASLRRPPATGRPLRPWLAEVVRNALRSGARGARNRAARERAAGDRAAGAVPTPEELLARHECLRLLGELVSGLAEPSPPTARSPPAPPSRSAQARRAP